MSSQVLTRNREKGIRLQKQANAMLLAGRSGQDYIKIRRQAEWHLGMWRWQEQNPSWKLPASKDLVGNNLTEYYPAACLNIKTPDGNKKCPYLPAGGCECKTRDCPSYDY